MPKATVDPGTTRIDLTTCPGGYVMLRALSFHEMEMRKDIAARAYREIKDTPQAKKGAEVPPERAYIESMNVAVTEFEFRNCIAEHNLFVDEAETQAIDFTKPMYTWKLDPKIGKEISEAIEKMTDSEEDLIPLETAPSSSSLEEKNKLEPSLTLT